MKKMGNSLMAWAGVGVGVGLTPFGVFFLFAWAFAESSFLPPPTEMPLITMCFKKSLPVAMELMAIATVGSVLGAAFGYFIGIRGGRPVALKFFKEEKVTRVEAYMQKYDAWAIGIAAFTPIPYKVFTIIGGVCRIHFWRFMLVSLLARGTRYTIISYLTYYFSKDMEVDAIMAFIKGPKFMGGTVAVVVVIAVIYVVHRMIKNRGGGEAAGAAA